MRQCHGEAELCFGDEVPRSTLISDQPMSAPSALTFSFSPLKLAGMVFTQRTSPTTPYLLSTCIFYEVSQRLSKNVLIFIFLLLLVTCIFYRK